MSLTYGFYNSENGDRRYNADQMSSIFDGIITDGIFGSIGSKLMLSEGTGMTVTVGTGRAWFKRTWTLNDSPLVVNIASSNLTLNRIDTVVLDVNKRTRVNSIMVVQGTPASNPTAPTLIFNDHDEHYQYPLGNVRVDAGATQIPQAKITNRVGVDYPFVTAATQHVSAAELVAQWEDEFDTWMQSIRGTLDGDTAGNLLNRIDGVADDLADMESRFSKFDQLWKNASQTSAFAKQAIMNTQLGNAKANYDALLIRCRYSTNYGYEQNVLLQGSEAICIFPPTIMGANEDLNALSTHTRTFVWTDVGVDVRNGVAFNPENNQLTNYVNSYTIPIIIYGIKW